MPPRRALGASGFDIVVQQSEGAWKLWRIINKGKEKFQAARSLYIQISEEGFDDADDDQWAIALEAIRPGNIKHNLKHVKVEIVGQARFLGYSPVVLTPPSTTNIYREAQTSFMGTRPTHFVQPAVNIPSERAFIKALSNLRDIEKVEIAGPMDASLKRQLAVAMTTCQGQSVRDWRYGGGLRSDDDISLGTWSAAMPAADGEGDSGASAYALNPFYSQTFLPQQPMQTIAYANYEPNRRASLTQVGRFEEMIAPKLPLDYKFSSSSPDFDSKAGVLGGYGSSNSSGHFGGSQVKKEEEEEDGDDGEGKGGKLHGLSSARQSRLSNGSGKYLPPQELDGDGRGFTERADEQTEEDDYEESDDEWLREAIPSDDSRDEDYEE